MNAQNRCVFDSSTENLNTSMRIKLDDGSSVTVWVSDKYADSATLATVKQAYLKKREERDQLIAKAKEIGLVLHDQMLPDIGTVQTNEEQTVVDQQPKQVAQLNQEHRVAKRIGQETGGRIIDGRAADKPLQLNNVKIEGSGITRSGSEYEISSTDKPSTDLKEGEVAEIGIVKGRCGLDIAIPIKRSGKMGSTEIRVVDSGGNAELQRRFKNLASDQNSRVDFRNGYDVKIVKCPLCRGAKMVRNKPCPKCGGAGDIELTTY